MILNFIRRLLGTDEQHDLQNEFMRIKLDMLRTGRDLVARNEQVMAERPRSPTIDEIVRSLEERWVSAFIPEPPTRTVLWNGDIRYENSSYEVVRPGQTAVIVVGVPQSVAGTGWPGLSQTERQIFGVKENFKPKKITLSPGFGLCGAFMGSANSFPNAPSSGLLVSSEHLASDQPQPDYPMAEVGTSITINVKNMTNYPRPVRAAVIGMPSKTEKEPS